jgi:hypothetical protein
VTHGERGAGGGDVVVARKETAMATVVHGAGTDVEIQRDVLNELRYEPRVQPNEIGVAVKDGIVTLTAWVDSDVKKWAAEEAAHRVRGVRAVANDIEVRLPVADERLDPDIAAAVVRGAGMGHRHSRRHARRHRLQRLGDVRP